jgi:desulfoferrodoxin (superoxide reductase-like protein)
MIVRPSFKGEYTVILHGTKEDYEVDLDKTPKFFLSCFAAEKNIWYSMPEHNEEKQQKEIKVTVATGEVARPLAKRIHGLWVQMLKRTRYFDDDRISVDGTTFEFTARGMHGETQLQCTGPTLLVKLGHALVEFCQAPPTDGEAATKNIEKAASELETYLKAHRAK